MRVRTVADPLEFLLKWHALLGSTSRVTPCSFKSASLLECDVDQQLFALHIDNVAEGALALSREVEPYASATDPQVTNVQVLQPLRQFGIDDVQLFARRAWPQPQDGGEYQEHRARSPRLR